MYDDLDNEDSGKNILGVVVRCFGFILLIIGLLLAFMTIREAFKLYHNPDRIERFTLAIEKGSNIDKSLSSLQKSAISENNQDETAPLSEYTAPVPVQKPETVRVSYFLAWIIVLLLLLLMARISLAAVKTGGELVLYDMQMKKFARMLVKEANRR